MFSENYVRLVLAVAPFLVCLANSLERQLWSKVWARISLGSGILFSLSVLLSPLKIWACLPWLVLCLVRAALELKNFAQSSHRSLGDLAKLSATVYLPVGGIWALFDQLQFQPLGFSHIIVLLTGVHFHYAGFALPRLAGLWMNHTARTKLFQAATIGIILGVPLVAIGITSSQLNLPFWVETLSVTVLASSAFVMSFGHLSWSFVHAGLLRWLFAIAGLALAGGMILALIYGWREVYLVNWATIPAMYAIHGTLNSWGFCLPAFIGWKILRKT